MDIKQKTSLCILGPLLTYAVGHTVLQKINLEKEKNKIEMTGITSLDNDFNKPIINLKHELLEEVNHNPKVSEELYNNGIYEIKPKYQSSLSQNKK